MQELDFLLPHPTSPIRLVPRRSIVGGSGTGLVCISVQRSPENGIGGVEHHVDTYLIAHENTG